MRLLIYYKGQELAISVSALTPELEDVTEEALAGLLDIIERAECWDSVQRRDNEAEEEGALYDQISAAIKARQVHN